MKYTISDLKSRLALHDRPLDKNEIEALYQAIRCLETVTGITAPFLCFGVHQDLGPSPLPPHKDLLEYAKTLIGSGFARVPVVRTLRERYPGLSLKAAVDVVNEAWPPHG